MFAHCGLPRGRCGFATTIVSGIYMSFLISEPIIRILLNLAKLIGEQRRTRGREPV